MSGNTLTGNLIEEVEIKNHIDKKDQGQEIETETRVAETEEAGTEITLEETEDEVIITNKKTNM